MPQGEVDAMAEVHFSNGNKITLLIEAKDNGQPRNARDAANKLFRYREHFPHAYPVFAAPYISPETAEIIARQDVGYIDLSGNSRLTFDHVYIRREGWPNKFAKRRDLRSLYSAKAERLLRVLLLEPKRVWRLAALAKAANVSIGQTSNVKRLLEDREWIGRNPEGIALMQPEKLLEEWAANYRFSRNTVRNFYTLDSIPQIEAKLATACSTLQTKYALTSFSAAARMAPMVRYQRAAAYVAGSIDEIARHMGLKEVASGANISLIAPYDEGVLDGSREFDGIQIACAVQTYLDLVNYKGRGEEAAQALLDEVIKPTW